MVHEVVQEDEADILCQMPKSPYHQRDQLIWRCMSNGEFSVTSAYHLEKDKSLKGKGNAYKLWFKEAYGRELGI